MNFKIPFQWQDPGAKDPGDLHPPPSFAIISCITLCKPLHIFGFQFLHLYDKVVGPVDIILWMVNSCRWNWFPWWIQRKSWNWIQLSSNFKKWVLVITAGILFIKKGCKQWELQVKLLVISCIYVKKLYKVQYIGISFPTGYIYLYCFYKSLHSDLRM